MKVFSSGNNFSSLLFYRLRGLIISLLPAFMIISPVFAQIEKFKISVRNVIQTAPDKLEFDVYLLDTDSGQPFEMALCQLGFLLNSQIYTDGNLSVAIDNTNTGLKSSGQFSATPGIVTNLGDYPGQTLVRLAGHAPPGAGNGTIISCTEPGTLLTHFILTSSVSFKSFTTPDIAFTSSSATSPLYPTHVSEYVNGLNTPLTVAPGVNAIVYDNPVLNQTVNITRNILNNSLRIFPNPIGDKLNIEIPGYERPVDYRIYNSAGALVLSGVFTGKASLPAGELSAGTYLIRLGSGNISASRTFIKK